MTKDLIKSNDENLHRSKRNKQRSMELETEIPIWYNGRVKWISNLTYRSRCCDVIEAILTSDCDSYGKSEDYVLYECWRGVERALKGRCRLLKLWNCWSGECSNVILTLRYGKEEIIPTHIIIRQQEIKLNKLKRQLKRTNKQIDKLNIFNKLNLNNYFNLSHSIIHLNNQIENKKKLILNLITNIQNETKQDFCQDQFQQLLFDVNQTLISSRKLTILSDDIDQQIQLINQNIDSKQTLLDELELDCALQENIHIDNLDEQTDLFKQISPSPTPPPIPLKSLTVPTRPTAIVEPSPSTFKSKESLSKSSSTSNDFHFQKLYTNKPKIHFIPFSIKLNYQFNSNNNNEQSDTGICSTHSNQQQLITLV